MSRSTRSFFALLLTLTALGACTSADSPVTPRMSPDPSTPHSAKIPATDSLMVLTTELYSDTAEVLQWNAPLAGDVTVSSTIGSSGGTIKIDSLGIKVTIPSGALSSTQTITMTVRAGSAVAYEFGPHGLTFAKPVKVNQSLQTTIASTHPEVVDGMYAGYFDVALDSAFIDAGKTKAKVKETQIGYKESGNQIKFFIEHFSGYMLSMGRSRTIDSGY